MHSFAPTKDLLVSKGVVPVMKKHEIDTDPNTTPSSDALEWQTPEFAVLDISKATMAGLGASFDGGMFADSHSTDDHS